MPTKKEKKENTEKDANEKDDTLKEKLERKLGKRHGTPTGPVRG